MLDNTKKGFAEELTIVLSLTFLLLIPAVWYNCILYHYHPLVEALVAGFIAIFFLVFFIVRIIRLAIVYENYKVLYSLLGFLFILAFSSLAVLYSDRSLVTILLVITVHSSLGVAIFIIKRAKKSKRFDKEIPPQRYAALRSVLTTKQRLTLVFPDRYIKYLETGDEKYLKGEE